MLINVDDSEEKKELPKLILHPSPSSSGVKVQL